MPVNEGEILIKHRICEQTKNIMKKREKFKYATFNAATETSRTHRMLLTNDLWMLVCHCLCWRRMFSVTKNSYHGHLDKRAVLINYGLRRI